MLKIILFLLFWGFSINSGYALGVESSLYCSDFSVTALSMGETGYSNCSEDIPSNSYFKVFLKDNRVFRTERYEGRLVGIKNFRYYEAMPYGLSGIEDVAISENNGKRLISYTFSKVATDTKSIVLSAISSQINLNDAKSYSLKYSRKIEEYDNDELIRVSYYYGESSERLLIRLYYSNEKVYAYKLQRYIRGFRVEEYHEGTDKWFRFYTDDRLALTYHYTDKRQGYYFSLYYSSPAGQLLLKETYYVLYRNTAGLRRRIEAALLSPSKFASLEEERRFWRKLLRVFVRNEADALKSYNVDVSNVLMDRVSYFREGISGVDRKGPFLDQVYLKIEYYINGIIRRVEHFDLAGKEEKVEHYNYLGERVFDR